MILVDIKGIYKKKIKVLQYMSLIKMNELILVTGGTGFIGSHTAVELMQAGFRVAIIDNLSNSRKEVIRWD